MELPQHLRLVAPLEGHHGSFTVRACFGQGAPNTGPAFACSEGPAPERASSSQAPLAGKPPRAARASGDEAPATAAEEPTPEPAPEPVTAQPKRRGRPPGSKNKPKPPKTVPVEEVAPPAPEPAQPSKAPTATAPAPPEPPRGVLHSQPFILFQKINFHNRGTRKKKRWFREYSPCSRPHR